MTVLDLPDELLSRIFLLAYHSSSIPIKQESILASFISTCRRFRVVANGVTELWTEIRTTHHPDFIATSLQRSAGAPLDIHIDCASPEFYKSAAHPRELRGILRTFLERILPHSNRWRQVTVMLETNQVQVNGEDWPIVFMPCIASACKGLSLPILDSISIQCDNNVMSEQEDIVGEGDEFYSTWAMPKLGKVTLDGYLPNAPFPATVTHASISAVEPFSIADVLKFLRHHPDLLSLQVDVGPSRADEEDLVQAIRFPPIRQLSITNCSDVDYAPHFLRSIPSKNNIEELSVCLRGIQGETPPGVGDSFSEAAIACCSAVEQWPALTTINFTLDPVKPSGSVLRETLARLKKLKHLVICDKDEAWSPRPILHGAPLGIGMPLDPGLAEAPALETLTLRHCRHSVEELRSLQEFFNKDVVNGGSTKIEVKGMIYGDTSEVNSLLSSGHVVLK